jgi:hypothetical protein
MPSRPSSIRPNHSSALDLFGGPVALPRFRCAPTLLSVAEERQYFAMFEALPLKPFEFHGYLGKRRIVSYGWRYDYAGRALRAAEPMPDFLVTLKELASSFSGIKAKLDA